jgi:hypothetical protein
VIVKMKPHRTLSVIIWLVITHQLIIFGELVCMN